MVGCAPFELGPDARNGTAILLRGSTACGGAASSSEGHHLAFGNTEEELLRTILGSKQRGQPTDPPLDHSTGYGYYVEARFLSGSKLRMTTPSYVYPETFPFPG